ncbi:MAG: 50S ribosomal protein L30 [Armatimonadetes bacterium]|nr:50S ribosomal protein L30 [Armatimonadota bacterium]
MSGKLKITLKKSLIGVHKRRKLTARALGLRRISQTVVQPDNPSIRGMIAVIADLVEVERAEG